MSRTGHESTLEGQVLTSTAADLKGAQPFVQARVGIYFDDPLAVHMVFLGPDPEEGQHWVFARSLLTDVVYSAAGMTTRYLGAEVEFTRADDLWVHLRLSGDGGTATMRFVYEDLKSVIDTCATMIPPKIATGIIEAALFDILDGRKPSV